MTGSLASRRGWTRVVRLRRSSRLVPLATVLFTVLLAPASSLAASGGGLADRDIRTRAVPATVAQKGQATRLGAAVIWNRFGTPASLLNHRGVLATGVKGETAVAVARNFVASQERLFRLSKGAVDRLELVNDARLGDRGAHAVTFRQRFGGLPAVEGGLLTVAVSGDRIIYASSSVAAETELAAKPRLSPVEAWTLAASDIGFGGSIVNVRAAKPAGEWTQLAVNGLDRAQAARLVAVPTPTLGVRPAYETVFVDVHEGYTRAYLHYVDAATGAVLVRKNIVEQSHPAAATFEGSVPPADGLCAPDNGPWTVSNTETVGSVAVAVEATLTTNDSVIHLVRNGTVVASQDTGTSPEVLVYDPLDNGRGTYFVRVCDFSDGAGWLPPTTYTGEIAFNPVTADGNFPFPPKWKVFPAFPGIGNETYPWNYPNADTRQVWCWDSTPGTPPVALPECQREVQNPASPAPWDFNHRTQTPTFTTSGNNAVTAEAWAGPLTPGPTAFRPVSLQREYVYPWTNAWHTSSCFTPFVPGQSHDISAAVTNLFAMHNRMHDWSYNLGFTEEHWNAQDSNLGRSPGTADRDPLIGNAQAGALDGGFPSYLGRDNANMVPLPDGVPPITNMYLWQPLAGAFYAPCVDGDYDMAVIGHEFTHLIENRMIGKGGTRGGHHAGAMGESFADVTAVEYLNEYGLVPVSGENPFAVGAYVTGNKQRAIRNYGMNFPRTGAFPSPGTTPQVNPLNFSDMGYDITGPQVHADGEIWSATNYDIRQALVQKHGAGTPQVQRECADGLRAVDQCPGNRRWMQIVFDAYLLMPTAPSMLEARNAYLAADQARFGGANQAELWLAFARRGFGENAFSTNTGADTDVDPRPDFASPLHGETNVTFRVIDAETKAAVPARVFVGHYEARVSPIADTDPATTGGNLDDVAQFVAGAYDFEVAAPGYGHFRFSESFSGSGNRTLTISLPTNLASLSKGGVATGDGAEHAALIDDTEATNWDVEGAQPTVAGSQVTVDLAGDVRQFDRVQVSTLLHWLPGVTGPTAQNRLTALRGFELWACTASAANASCSNPDLGFTRIFTSAANAFPGINPRPVAPEMIMRTFGVPRTTATHVQLRVLTNQCTGNTAFQGEQDADPLNGTDCREGSPGAEPVELPGDLPQALAPRDNEVHVAELQVFKGNGSVKRGS